MAGTIGCGSVLGDVIVKLVNECEHDMLLMWSRGDGNVGGDMVKWCYGMAMLVI